METRPANSFSGHSRDRDMLSTEARCEQRGPIMVPIFFLATGLPRQDRRPEILRYRRAPFVS